MQEERKGGQMQNKHVEWNARFKELLDYRSEHGDCDVPVTQGKLGQWVRSQRRAYRAESLAQDRIGRLSSIGFKWKQKGPNVPWETRFDELVQYKAKHGDCDVPTKQGKLGTWVGTQRGAYRDDKLEQGCIDRLNSIGFKWRVVKEKVPWDTQFKELVQYKAKHGDCKVSDRQGPLGRWVRHQRESYKKNRLSQDSIDRLNGIGFDWTCARTRPWEIRFNELVKYKAKHGICIVPQRQGPLGKWADKQRTTYKWGKLSQDRIDRLNGIGFDWTPPMGGSRKRKALPSCTWEQSSSIQMRVPSLSKKVGPLSTGARAMGVDVVGVKGEGFEFEPSLPQLQIPSSKSNHNHGTSESDDEVDEIGALIYDQVMRNKGNSK